MRTTTLIFCWIGTDLPFYALESLSLTRAFNPCIRIDLILSDSVRLDKHSRDLLKFINIRVYLYKCEGANGLWQLSFLRLLLVSRHASAYSFPSFIHAELDNVVFSIDYIEQLEMNSCRGVFIPHDGGDRGFGSIMYVNDHCPLQELFRYDYDEFNQNFSEMMLLGGLLKTSSGFFRLPTFGVETYHSDVALVSNAKTLVFDAAALGQYLLGTDIRGTRGLTFNRFQNSFYSLGDYPKDIFIDESKLLVSLSNEDLYVANIHIHSKNVRLLSSILLRRLSSKSFESFPIGLKIIKSFCAKFY